MSLFLKHFKICLTISTVDFLIVLEPPTITDVLIILNLVTERVLSWNERPWEIMKQLGKDSIRQMELMRFYLQLKQDPHGPNLALFVGNLPPNLSERNYENILTEFLGKGMFSSVDKGT